VAWAITIPYLVVSFLFWPGYLRKWVGVPVGDLVSAAWARPLVAAVPFAACTYALEHFWPAHHLALFFMQVGLILPIAMVGFWYLCLTAEDRRMLSDSLLRPALRLVRPE